MSELKKNGKDADLHLSVLTAITGALREEKVPACVRVSKVLTCSVLLTALLATVFFKLFESQMNRTWQITGIAWFLYFVAGFALLFKPQVRMILSNVWSPLVIARLFLVSTLATIL